MDHDKANYLEKELSYIEVMGSSVGKEDCYNFFPVDWYANKDYKLKEEILDEAILKKSLIMNTGLYVSNMQEGVIDLDTIINSKQNLKNRKVN